jgi:hypothetical protein
LAGKGSSGSWDTQAWLINMDDAYLDGATLVADTDNAEKLVDALGSKPTHVKGDVFEAKDKPNVPDRKKLTETQQSPDPKT